MGKQDDEITRNNPLPGTDQKHAIHQESRKEGQAMCRNSKGCPGSIKTRKPYSPNTKDEAVGHLAGLKREGDSPILLGRSKGIGEDKG